jgi:hypothetical protein
MKKLNKIKTSAALALLLISTQISAETKARKNSDSNDSVNNPININTIIVDKSSKIEICPVPEKATGSVAVPHRILSLAFNSESEQPISITFTMANISSTLEERVLILFQGRCLLDKPKIETPKSVNILAMDIDEIEILGAYNVPTMHPIQLSSRVGSAGTLSTQMTFTVHLAPDKLGKEVDSGNRTFYVQAGLLDKKDFLTRQYKNLILSPIEGIHFSPKNCPNISQLTENLLKKNARCTQEMPSESQGSQNSESQNVVEKLNPNESPSSISHPVDTTK